MNKHLNPDTTPQDSAQILGREFPFRGRLVTVRVDRILLPNGREAVREVVLHPGAVAIVAIPIPGAVLLVRQYRHPAGTSLWEIPAGKLEPGENPLACAQRELEEETGYRASTWTPIRTVYTTPGFADERITLYVASDLRHVRDADDRDVTECAVVTSAQLEQMLEQDEIQDAKTILGLLSAGLVQPTLGDNRP